MRATAAFFVCLLGLAARDAAAVMPGGMASGSFSAPASSTTLEMIQRVERDPGLQPYFWATQFWIDTAIDHGGYFGMQANGSNGSQLVGNMFIFSIWNADAAEPGPGAVATEFEGEGVGYSLRLPHDWQEGVDYRFVLSREADLWWRVRVYGPGLEADMGRIRVTVAAPLRPGAVVFTEYYRDVASCTDVPPARARFHGMRQGNADGIPFAPNTYGNCAQLATASLDGNGMVHTIRAVGAAIPESLTGSWFEPATSGQGFTLELIDADRFILFFYGFDTFGDQLWLYGDYTQGPDGFAFGEPVAVPMYFTAGTRWGAFDPGAVTRTLWGTATFVFEDCSAAGVVLDGTTGQQSLALQKLITPRGIDCP
jgi:hypothetical protein